MIREQKKVFASVCNLCYIATWQKLSKFWHKRVFSIERNALSFHRFLTRWWKCHKIEIVFAHVCDQMDIKVNNIKNWKKEFWQKKSEWDKLEKNYILFVIPQQLKEARIFCWNKCFLIFLWSLTRQTKCYRCWKSEFLLQLLLNKCLVNNILVI